MLVRLFKRILLKKIFWTLIEQLIMIDCNYNWNEVNKRIKNVHLRGKETERWEYQGQRDGNKNEGRRKIWWHSIFPLRYLWYLLVSNGLEKPPLPNLSTSARHRNFVPFPVFPAVFLPSPPPSFSPGETFYPAKQQEKLKWMQTSIEGGRGILLLTQDLYF